MIFNLSQTRRMKFLLPHKPVETFLPVNYTFHFGGFGTTFSLSRLLSVFFGLARPLNEIFSIKIFWFICTVKPNNGFSCKCKQFSKMKLPLSKMSRKSILIHVNTPLVIQTWFQCSSHSITNEQWATQQFNSPPPPPMFMQFLASTSQFRVSIGQKTQLTG